MDQDSEARGLTLLDLLLIVVRNRWFLLRIIILASIIATIVAFLIPVEYTAKSTILPPTKNSSLSPVLGQLEALASIAGKEGMKNQSDVYVAVLQSRTIADALIERFRLQDLYKRTTLVDTRESLKEHSFIVAGKDDVITIQVTDKDAKRAADIANAYAEELYKVTNTVALTEASRRRLFFEKQLVIAKDNLSVAEVNLRKLQERTGMIEPGNQGKAIVDSIALLRGQIAAKEVQVATMRAFATAENPAYVRAQQELAGLRTQLSRLENSERIGEGNIYIPTKQVPEVILDYFRAYREVKYSEKVFETLAKELEIAKIDEAKDSSSVQVLDRAVAPDKKSKPKRALIIGLTAIAAALLSLVYLVALEGIRRFRAYSAEAPKLDELLRSLPRRPSSPTAFD